MKRTVIYARYSSDRQTEQSIEGQLRVCNEYAEKNDMKIVKTYIDRAKTGRNDDRDAFQKMLKDSDSKQFEIVLVYALDRFARNKYDSAINKRHLKKNGITVISATQTLGEGPEAILIESLFEGLDEYYSAELALKVARGRRESVEVKGQFVGGTVAYGYKIVSKKYVINEDEAKVVQYIFDLYKELRNFKMVVDQLKSECLYYRNGKPWKYTTIQKILRNKLYTGFLKSGIYEKKDAVPVIIDEKKFNEVQKLMEEYTFKKSKSPAKFILTGKLFCGKCGRQYTGDSSSRNGKFYYYYTCRKGKVHSDCDSKRFQKDKLENFVYSKIIEEVTKSTFFDRLLSEVKKYYDEFNYDNEIDRLKSELNSVSKKMDNIIQAIEDGFYNEKIKQQNAELLEQEETLKVELQKIQYKQKNRFSEEKIKNIVTNKIFKNKDNMEYVVSAFLHKATIYDDHIEIILTIPNGDDDGNGKKKVVFDYTTLRSTKFWKPNRLPFFIPKNRQKPLFMGILAILSPFKQLKNLENITYKNITNFDLKFVAINSNFCCNCFLVKNFAKFLVQKINFFLSF